MTIPITVKSSEPAFEIKNFSLGSYVIDQIDRSEYKRNSLKNIEQFLDDANGDGVLDLIVIARGEAPFATVIYSVCNAAEQWGEHVSLSTEPLGENDTITVEDVNGDGKLDIVIQYNDRSGQYAALANAVGGWSAVQRILKGENGSWGMPSYVTGASAFQVDASMGSASFIQPISVPTGRAGVQPDLAIQYSSTGGYSELGQSVGLSLKSAISRCGSSYLRDGIVKEVSLTNNDYACLDGVRLILLAGEYWGNGSRYRPESGHQYEVEYSTGGTTSFVVTHSNGDVYTYGGSVDSTVKGGQPIEVNAKWALRRATVGR